MQISFLQAGNGDCILLQGGGKNVLIDSGEDCTELRNVVIDIRNAQEAIDLLVITHYDSDHIKTIVSILKVRVHKSALPNRKCDIALPFN